MQVNISSERVRRAISFLEGMRNGQELGALLGYLFERNLHDAYPNLEMDEYILPIREVYPHLEREELETAEENLERYVATVLRIYERVSAESYPHAASIDEGRKQILGSNGKGRTK